MANDFRSTDELLDVNYAITDKRSLMNKRFQDGELGEAINYARCMLKATCKHVYHELTGEEVEDVEGHDGYISLKNLSDINFLLL